jgi:hypothetical protein
VAAGSAAKAAGGTVAWIATETAIVRRVERL